MSGHLSRLFYSPVDERSLPWRSHSLSDADESRSKRLIRALRRAELAENHAEELRAAHLKQMKYIVSKLLRLEGEL